MYWILNFLPVALQIVFVIYSIVFNGFTEFSENRMWVTFLWAFILLPIYLLIINLFYINKKQILYFKSIIMMITTIFLKTFVVIIENKFKMGMFFDEENLDIQIFLIKLQIIIPVIIICITMGVKCVIDKFNHTISKCLKDKQK